MSPSHTKRFIKGVSFMTSATFVQIFCGFVGVVLAIRYLPKGPFGAFVLIQVTASLFRTFNSLLIQDFSVTKFIAGAENEEKVIISNVSLSYKLLFTVITCVLIFVCRPLITLLFKSDYLHLYFYFIPLLFFVENAYEIAMRVLQGYHRYKIIATAQILNGVVKLILILIFIRLFHWGVIGLFWAFVLSSLFAAIFQLMFFPFRFKPDFSKSIYHKIFRFGFPLGLNSILSFIFLKIDRFMIGAMLSIIGVASYEIASKIPETCRRMYESFHMVFFPSITELFSSKRMTEAEAMLNNSLRFISFISFFFALVIALFQKDIVLLIFSNKYAESGPALALLMISLSISLIGNTLGTSLVAIGRSDMPVKLNIIETVTNFGTNFLLIPIYGFMGAVYATVLSRTVINPFIVWVLRKNNVRVNIKDYVAPFGIYALCYGVFFLLPSEGFLLKIAVSVLFIVLSFFLKLLQTKDIVRVYSAFGKK